MLTHLFIDLNLQTSSMSRSGLWKISAVISSEPFKFASMNLKKSLVSLKMHVSSCRRWISIMNSLNAIDLRLSQFNKVIVFVVWSPWEISERAIAICDEIFGLLDWASMPACTRVSSRKRFRTSTERTIVQHKWIHNRMLLELSSVRAFIQTRLLPLSKRAISTWMMDD